MVFLTDARDSTRRSYRFISLDLAGKQCRIRLPNLLPGADDAHLARATPLFLAGSPAV